MIHTLISNILLRTKKTKEKHSLTTKMFQYFESDTSLRSEHSVFLLGRIATAFVRFIEMQVWTKQKAFKLNSTRQIVFLYH